MSVSFDSALDDKLIAAGTHFYCHACLIARPVEEHSPDPRYCKGCYEFLNLEAANDPRGRRPRWAPALPAYSGAFRSAPVPGDGVSLMGAKEILRRQRGRPRVIGTKMSRTTRWRRLQEVKNQEAMPI